ncbi:MAG: hypothetical protein K9N35_04560 [Candidatus Marinimicrobia bacterium]|nr:hypothetical protein [Candidatus Neomarinimicrobiota bacterium]
MLKLISYFSPFLILFVACTSHPVVSPDPLKPGETYQGVLLSAENIAPQFLFRKGLSERMDAGLRIGLLPILGTGLDMTLTLRDEGEKLHTLNLAGTYAEQSTVEATYYNISRKPITSIVKVDGKKFKKTEKDIFNYGYLGLRYAYLITGMWGDKTHQFGVLYGLNFKGNWGAEMGYFHDFSGRKPESDYGFNPKYAPLGGLSLRIWFGRLSRK